jgi:hypothetical protein
MGVDAACPGKTFSVERSLAYIDGIFRNYLANSDLCPQALEGKCVLEVGPGDNLGVALRFLAAGAAQVISVDRFFSWRDPEKERRIYRALRETLDVPARARFDNAVDLSDGIGFNPERLRYIYGKGVEEVRLLLGASCCDVIVSCAVLEEIDDLDTVFSDLDYFLRPGGTQIHIIDLRDYGTLTRFGFHPLEFCTIPDPVYRYASKFSRPNRRRIDYYRRKMDQLGYSAKFPITFVCGREAALSPFKVALERGIDFTDEERSRAEVIRPRLLARYRGLPAEDLLAAGFVLVARKPEPFSQYNAESCPQTVLT